jgi:hypothetical protein
VAEAEVYVGVSDKVWLPVLAIFEKWSFGNAILSTEALTE